MAFPILSVAPSISGWEEGKASDPTIRSTKEGGYVSTRPRFTRIPKKWQMSYSQGNALPLADKLLLEAHEESVHVGANSFTWTNPMDGVTYTVRYVDGPIKFKPLVGNVLWEATISLEQV
jgi:hypothetical protein